MSRASPIIIVLVLLCLLAFLSVFSPASPAGADTAESIVAACRTQGGDRAACYESAVPELYPEISLEAVFEVVRQIRTLDSSYQFCHVLAHKLGERVVAEDPARWIDAIPSNPPDGICSNGFIHGVIGGKFRAEVLDDETLEAFIPDFSRACEPRAQWNPTPLDQAICYHGMGHLYMFITDADIRKALSLCERTARSSAVDFRRVCREGVFMQIYQPLEPDDFLLIERMDFRPSTSTVRQFCSTFEEDEYEGACLRESWPFFRDSIMQGSGVAAFCAGQPTAQETEYCYQSALTIIARFSVQSSEQLAKACDSVEKHRQGMCYSIGARAIIEEDKSKWPHAVSFCTGLPASYAEACFMPLAQTSAFMFGTDSPERRAFCSALPSDVEAVCMR